MHSVFVIFDAPGVGLTADEIASLRNAVAAIPGLAEARIMIADLTPSDQPFAKDGPGPALVLQLYFATKDAAAASLAAGGALAELAGHAALSRLKDAHVSHQLMEARLFPVGAGAPADPCCTFFVTYPGTTADLASWLDHYDANHPPIMRRFPRIREVETYRPIAWTSGLGWARSDAMQRNKVVFDSLGDLIAALASPVMEEMLADGRAFAPRTGKTTHHPMTTYRVAGAAAKS